MGGEEENAKAAEKKKQRERERESGATSYGNLKKIKVEILVLLEVLYIKKKVGTCLVCLDLLWVYMKVAEIGSREGDGGLVRG